MPYLDSLESRMNYYLNEVSRCYQLLWQEVAERHSKGYDCSEQQHQQLLLGGRVKPSWEHHALGQECHACYTLQSFVVGIVRRIKPTFLRLFHGQIVHLYLQCPCGEYKCQRCRLSITTEENQALVLIDPAYDSVG